MQEELGLGGAEEQYALFMECVADYAIFLMDADGRVAAWNTGAERIFGYSEDEVLGLPFATFFTTEDVERSVPQKELRAAVEHGRASDDRWLVRKDGTRLWVSGVTTALQEDGQLRGFAKVTRDRTEQRRAEEVVLASEKRLRALFENAWDGVTLIGADGTMLETTAITFRGLGYSPEEYVGRNSFELLHPEDVPRVQGLLAQLLGQPGGKLTAQYRMRHKDGSWRWVESVACNLLNEPAVRAVVVNHRDVTQQKALEDALKRQGERLAEDDRRKDEFLAMLAHELRNALAPLQTSLHIMRLTQGGTNTSAQARELVERQVEQMTRLVDDLLDISRVSSGKLDLRREPIELEAVIRRAVAMSRPLIDAAGHQLTVQVPSERVLLDADSTRLVQVLSNLLNNAAKFTERGGQIALVAERAGREVLLRVRDTGVGISAESLPRLFDLFSQAGRTLERSQGGLGIGLSLVKQLVELHGGSVTGHSEGPGRGSEFVVRLPLRQQARKEAESAEECPQAALSTCRVLVVDDNKDGAESLARLVRDWGHEVCLARDGPSALETVREFRPHVVLLDIGLPGMNGWDVARQLRKEESSRAVLLVAVTGYGKTEDQARSREAGLDAHLTKPADLRQLQELLATTSRALAKDTSVFS